MAKLTDILETKLSESTLRKDLSYRVKAEKKGGFWLEYRSKKKSPYGGATWMPVKHFNSKEDAHQYLKDNKEK
jgi:hypothetical protein